MIGLWWIDRDIFKNKFKSNNYVKMNISTYSEVFLNKYQALGFLGIEMAPLELLAETLILGGQKTLLFMKKRVLWGAKTRFWGMKIAFWS